MNNNINEMVVGKVSNEEENNNEKICSNGKNILSSNIHVCTSVFTSPISLGICTPDNIKVSRGIAGKLKKESVSAVDDPLSTSWNGVMNNDKTVFFSTNPCNLTLASNSSISKHLRPKTSNILSISGVSEYPSLSIPSLSSNKTYSLISKTQSFTSNFSSFASKAASSLQEAMHTASRVGSISTQGSILFCPSSSKVNTGGSFCETESYGGKAYSSHSVLRNNKENNISHCNKGRIFNKTSFITRPINNDKVEDNNYYEMNNAKKTAVVTSAIGSLLPGEQVIMFVSHLINVSDSSTPQTGIGCSGFHRNDKNDLIWCYIMTFYRVIIFSFRQSDFDNDRSIIPPSLAENKVNSVSNDLKVFEQMASISREYQQYHMINNRKHFVIQMPLASIERIEKVTDISINNSCNTTTPLFTLPNASSSVIKMSQLRTTNTSTIHSHVSNGTSISYGTGTLNHQRIANSGIIILGKDNNRFFKFFTTSIDYCSRAYELLNIFAFPGSQNLGFLFAFESRRKEVKFSEIYRQDESVCLSNAEITRELNPFFGSEVVSEIDLEIKQNDLLKNITAHATPKRFDALVEFGRMGILQPWLSRTHGVCITSVGARNIKKEITKVSSPWKPFFKANANYNICQSYPSILFGPSSVNESTTKGLRLLLDVASFRSENRTVTLTWSSRRDGASLWRSSQPKVGLQGNRSEADEKYLFEIASCAASARKYAENMGAMKVKPSLEFIRMLTGGINESDLIFERFSHKDSSYSTKCMMKIFDLRSKSSAMANRTAGYGYENISYYPNTTLNFYGIANIHAVRDSYLKISALCLNPSVNDVQWAQLVEDTKWLYHLRLILSTSWQAAFHIWYNRLPVLLHCSHGWDRTSQVAALAQLMLDGYYRTCKGFSCLIEKDFMAFGHPFHTRCAHGEGKGDQSSVGQSSVDEGQVAPIFMQFLDCVFQIVNQYPDYFEFNTKYLLVLSEHIYSCRFGTFLCDSEREREKVASIRQRTHCLWEYLDSCHDLINPFYASKMKKIDDIEESGALMMPLPTLLRNVTLWIDRFCMYGPKATVRCSPLKLNPQQEYIRNMKTSFIHKNVGKCQNTCDQYTLKCAIEEAKTWKKIAELKRKELVLIKSNFHHRGKQRKNK